MVAKGIDLDWRSCYCLYHSDNLSPSRIHLRQSVLSRNIGREIVLQYLEDWSHLPSLTLARKIYKENPAIYNGVEQVRSKIRRLKGQNGEYSRQGETIKTYMEKPGESATKFGIGNPFGLPESDEQEWLPFEIPKGNNNVLVLSDVHIPYHNIKALTAAIEYGKREKVNAVILNGDTMDCYALSRYEKDPRKRGFKEELEDTRKFLGIIQDVLQCPIYFKIGNHEARYEAFLKIKAPELFDISEYKLETLLRFGEYGTQLIESKQRIALGKLIILHGHEFGRSVFSPVNPARGYYMRAKRSMMAGHNHQTSEHSEPNLDGEVVTCWSTGCLSELHPNYMPINKWNHGAAHVKVYDDGSYDVHNFRIIDGRIY